MVFFLNIFLNKFKNIKLFVILESYRSNKSIPLKILINSKKILKFSGNRDINIPIWESLYNIVDTKIDLNSNQNRNKIICSTQKYLKNNNINKIRNKYKIILGPFTNMEEKKFSFKQYILVAKKLEKLFNLEFKIIGTSKEIKTQEIELINNSLKNFDILLDQNIDNLFNLMSESNLYLGNDTGPMHLAALAGINLVVISPHNFQNQYLPISNKFYLFRKKIDFSLYKSKKFPKNANIPFFESIEPIQILNKLENIIRNDLKNIS